MKNTTTSYASITLKTKSLGYNEQLQKEIFETTTFDLKDIKYITKTKNIFSDFELKTNILVDNNLQIIGVFLDTLEDVMLILINQNIPFTLKGIDNNLGLEDISYLQLIKNENKNEEETDKKKHISVMLSEHLLKQIDILKQNKNRSAYIQDVLVLHILDKQIKNINN